MGHPQEWEVTIENWEKMFCNFKSLGAKITQNVFCFCFLFNKKKCGKAKLDFLLIDEIQDLR